MLRAAFFFLVVFSLGMPALAEDEPTKPPRPLQSAFGFVADGHWTRAVEIAERDGSAAVAIINWLRLREGLANPKEVLVFLNDYPGWPGETRLRRANEEVMTHANFDDVLAFYDGYTPQTGVGVLNYARALTARGQVGEAEATLVLAWRTMDLTTAEHKAFVDAHADLLEPHHEARLEMALWRGLRDVKQMLPLVPKKTRKLAEARQNIENGKTIKDEALPDGGAENAGIAFARFVQLIKKDRDDTAIALILERSKIEGGLGEPQRWAGWRRFLARAKMREGETEIAYQLAAIHQLSEGSDYADLEWLSGYLALTYLDAPDVALDHFQRFRAAVVSPISLGRAGYWIGRAQEAAGDSEAAQLSFAFGAQYQTSFYGLLAAERAGLPTDPSLAGTKPEGTWRNAAFADSDQFKAGVLLLATGRLSLAEQFFVNLSRTLDADQLVLLGQALHDLQEPHLQVMIGKASARRGIVVPGPYYAIHPLEKMDLPIPKELALAIARRESEFDPGVVSGAGAQGLMQLMPGTASDVARDLGLKHDRRKVLSDWSYNAQLGSEYLSQLARRFDGNVVLVAAGYNAGPGRPTRWIEQYGDPRRAGTDMVDWIEHIPFRETRNYVMRVAESLPVYRARLGKDPLPLPFSRELVGRTLLASRLD